MDPALIAAGGTLGGGILLKGVEHMFGKKKNKEKAPEEIVAAQILAAIESPAEPDWSDKGWIADTHRRQYDEAQELGKVITVCYCHECKYERRQKEIEKQRRELAKMQAEIDAKRRAEAARQKKIKAEKYDVWTKTHTKPGVRVWNKGAYDFTVPRNLVPENAHLTLLPPTDPFAEPKFCKGQFSWVDKRTGGMKFMTAIGIERDGFVAKPKYNSKLEKESQKTHEYLKKAMALQTERTKK
jgi:hypothetical protein